MWTNHIDAPKTSLAIRSVKRFIIQIFGRVAVIWSVITQKQCNAVPCSRFYCFKLVFYIISSQGKISCSYTAYTATSRQSTQRRFLAFTLFLQNSW